MVELRSATEIMSSWQGGAENPVVSICCIAYNHEEYIAEAISGFLKQVTDFPFEVLIHDDASTDSTAKIIKEFEKLYPEIIKPIYQSVNKFSKGERINPLYNFPRAKGKYIALCDGDDYWEDPGKLKCQVDVLKKINVDMVFHPSAVLCDGVLSLNADLYENRVYSSSELTERNFHFVQTNTVLFRKDVLSLIDKSFWSVAPVGDFFIRMLATHRQGGYCLPISMSVYRAQAKGSWTEALKNNHKHVMFTAGMIAACKEFNSLFGGKYKNDFDKYYSRLVLSLLIKVAQDDKMFVKVYFEFKKYLLFSDKIKLAKKIVKLFIFRYFAK